MMPVFVILGLGAGVIIAVLVYHRLSKASRWTPDLDAPPPARPPASFGKQAFLAANPDFDVDVFDAKVRSAFIKIQRAWTEQHISSVRPFISDGMYQRFATQFRMMGLLKQRNLLDNIRIHGVKPVAFRRDGAFDAIDVWISASMSDSFACELDPSMNSDSEGDEPFVEYWSFIRKSGAGGSSVNLVADRGCPSCGAALP